MAASQSQVATLPQGAELFMTVLGADGTYKGSMVGTVRSVEQRPNADPVVDLPISEGLLAGCTLRILVPGAEQPVE